jgi:hypothetical protein
MKSELLDGARFGRRGACYTSDWIQAEFFTRWFNNFISFVKYTIDDSVVFLLDGYCIFPHE